MDAERTTRFSESLARCMADPGFLDRFYERFTSSSPEIAEKFKDTDFVRQKKALSSSLYLTVMAIEGGKGATTFLEGVAKRHARGALDIRPGLYEIWLDCLVDTAEEVDPEFDAELESIWRDTLRFGIDFMQSRY